MELSKDVNVFGSLLNFDQNGNNLTSYYATLHLDVYSWMEL